MKTPLSKTHTLLSLTALSASLLYPASAATLATWSIINPVTAIATLSNGTNIIAAASGGSSFGTFEISDPDWGGDFGNSFFPTVTSGNGLELYDAPGKTITFAFGPVTNNPELWYSNTIADFSFSQPAATIALTPIALNEATFVSSSAIDNTGTTSGGPGDPVQSAGMLTVGGVVANFSVDMSPGGPNELIRFAIVDPVPEPSSTALLGLGGMCFLLRRRRT